MPFIKIYKEYLERAQGIVMNMEVVSSEGQSKATHLISIVLLIQNTLSIHSSGQVLGCRVCQHDDAVRDIAWELFKVAICV